MGLFRYYKNVRSEWATLVTTPPGARFQVGEIKCAKQERLTRILRAQKHKNQGCVGLYKVLGRLALTRLWREPSA